MPNRILREGIITSERVARLSWQAEVLYRRLMSVADDYGRYFGKTALIRAACFPLQLDRVSEKDIEKWLSEIQAATLIRAYDVAGTMFIELLDFKQQIRAKKSKFPDPINGAEHMLDTSASSAQQKKISPHAQAARRILAKLNEQAGKNFHFNEASLTLIQDRLNEYDEQTLCGVIVDRVDAWKGDEKMQQYLRPATLFNKSKCAQYVGELPK